MAGNPNWSKGKSGNPGGRPKALVDVQALARKYTKEAIEMLAEVMQDVDAPASARVTAAESLLSRGWGKPAQPVTGESGGPIVISWLSAPPSLPSNGATCV